MKNKISIILLLIASIIFAQQTPAPKQSTAVTIVGAKAHIGNGKVISNSLIIFDNGKLEVVTDATTTKIAYRGEIINAEGKDIYPGFIVPNSTLGLVEIDAVKATIDNDEIGSMNPHIRSIIAYNPESKITETVKANGILMGQITPRGGSISGTSSVVQFDAWNYEDAVIKEDDGIHLNWPASFRRSGWWAQPGSITVNKNYIKQVKRINDFFENAKANNSEAKNLKNTAMKGVFNGNKALFIHANGEKEIVDAVAFKNKYGINKMVLVGAFEAYKVTNLLKNNDVSVILKRIHALPTTEDQDIKLPFKLPKLLDEAGILVALDVAGGRMERMQTRNLPFYAGTAVAYGLDYEKSIAMLTLNPAKILGIDKTVGSLEVNKDATLFISSGDALDMRTNDVVTAFIQGRKISLDTHQKKLYRKFTSKYSKK